MNLKKIKVAAVMDTFTYNCFVHECNIYQISPNNWMNEIQNFEPDFMFIESAWHGKAGLWYDKIAHCSREYYEMISYCRGRDIPVVFWNKEDPVHTDLFMPAAAMADFVFTTDIDCIVKYKLVLGHNKVYHLHFAAQPVYHNPVDKYSRKEKFCFAGAYYHKYPARKEIFDAFAKYFISEKGFDIYDRNYRIKNPEYAFPRKYKPYILGTLDSTEIDKAYKGYCYGVNMNTIQNSNTMFARRVFELMASNTVVIGNKALGLKTYFGELTISDDDINILDKMLEKYCFNEAAYRKYRLLGLRKVLTEHLYENRLFYILNTVFNKKHDNFLPKVYIIGIVENPKEFELLKQSFERQEYQNTEFLLLTNFDHNFLSDIKIKLFCSTDELVAKISNLEESSYLTAFSPRDYYGRYYLYDLILTTRYGTYAGIGKADYYQCLDRIPSINDISHTYRSVQSLSPRRSVFIKSYIYNENLIDNILYLQEIKGPDLFSIDEFNYCENSVRGCDEALDCFVSDQGCSLHSLTQCAENIKKNLNLEMEQLLKWV